MPRKSEGARLYQRPDTGIWLIRDTGGLQRSTGTRDRGGAEKAFARYIIERDGPCASDPTSCTVAEALEAYAREHAPTLADPERVYYAVEALLPLLGRMPVGAITGGVCRRYQRERGKAQGTVRKELGTLSAAVNFCHAEGYITSAPKIPLPPKSPPRDRWLSRDEAARLLWAAYRNPKSKHLARFILVAIYTGTRTEAILRMRFMPNTTGGWVDTDRGMMYRLGQGMTQTKKRQPPVKLPRQLLAHLRRWQRQGARFVVEVKGCRVASVKTSWRHAIKASGIDHCTRHDLRHTAITWAMQNGATKWDAAGFFGLGTDTLERVYGHHHPEHMGTAVAAMERGAQKRTETHSLKLIETG